MTTAVHRRLIAAGVELALERYAAGTPTPLDLAASEVAGRAGVARSAFYSLWPDVDGTRRTFDRYLDELVRYLERPRFDHRDLAVAALSGPGDWEAAIARLLQSLVRSLWGAYGGEHRVRSALRAAARTGSASSSESVELALALELVSRGHGITPPGPDWSGAATLLLILAEGVLATDVDDRLAVLDGTMRTTDRLAAAAAALLTAAT